MATTRTKTPKKKTDVIRLSPSGPEIDASLLGAIEAFDSISANTDQTILPGPPVPIQRLGIPPTATSAGTPNVMELKFPAVRKGRRLVLHGMVNFFTTAPSVRLQLEASFDGGTTFASVPNGEVNNNPGSAGPMVGFPQIWPIVAGVDIPDPVSPATHVEVTARLLLGGSDRIQIFPAGRGQATWLLGMIVRRPSVTTIAGPTARLER